jgi:hypothetical protein
MTTPYRTATPPAAPPPLPDPPRSPREWCEFVLSRADSIACAALSSFRCVRRRLGGRWAFIRNPWTLALDADGRIARGGWANLSECPVTARWFFDYGDEDRADDTVTNRKIRECRRALIAEHKGHCTCEVWP